MNTTAEAVAVRANEWWVTNTRGQQINFFFRIAILYVNGLTIGTKMTPGLEGH